MRVLLLLLLGAAAGAAPRFDLLVQGAVDTELQPLLAALEGRREIRVETWTFWTGRIGRKRVAVSRTDVGPINAVAATVLGIQRFRPAALINQGTAGAHNPGLGLWDIVVSERTIDYGAFKSTHGDAGTGVDLHRWIPLPHRLRLDGRTLTEFREFPAEPWLVEAALRVRYARGRVRRGNVGSAFQFNREIDYLQWMHRTLGTDTEDMESAFAAGAATALGVPYVAIRIVSDSEYHHPTFERIAGQYCAEFVLEVIRSLR